MIFSIFKVKFDHWFRMKISVIIPTYNGEKTIERAIRSILDQVCPCEIEILVCDDGSTDRTIEIARQFNCRIFINENNSGGPNKGRNAGIRNATGDYLAFLDQDDEWCQGKLTEQLKHVEDGAEFVYSRYIERKKQEG